MDIEVRTFFDRVYETTRSTGTGNLTLDGAVTGYLSFADSVQQNQRFSYVVEAIDTRGVPTGDFEIGFGHIVVSGVNTIFYRDEVIRSSTGTNKVNFTSGIKNVWIDLSSDDINYLIEGIERNAEIVLNASGNIELALQKAAQSEANAKASENAAKASETRTIQNEQTLANTVASVQLSERNAKTSETNAKTSETNAKTSENRAKTSETNAKTSETNAKTSETNASASEVNANSYLLQTQALEASASTSASNALASEQKAKTSETNAKTSEQNAKTYSDNATTVASLLAGGLDCGFISNIK